jgi:hypothetical protein
MLCDQCQTVEHCMKHGCIPIVSVSALDKQVSGNHYKNKGIQPIIYIHANDIGFCAGNVVKYVTRYKDKNGAADIRKAIHYLELLLELEYPESLLKE